MNKVELQASFGKKIHEQITIARKHMKRYYWTGDQVSYSAGLERMGRAFEDVEMMFSLGLITIEEALEWQHKISYEVSLV